MLRNCNPHTLPVWMSNGAATLEKSLVGPQKIKQSYHMPQGFYSRVHTKGMETCVHTKTCTQIFTAILFMTAKKWKNPKIHQLMNKTKRGIYPHNGILSATKINEALIHTTTLMNLETLFWVKTRHKRPRTTWLIPFTYDSIYAKCQKRRIHRQKVGEWLSVAGDEKTWSDA